MLCENVWSSEVYNGDCSTYLLDKAKGIIRCENPYCRTINMAKIIDHLSGSVFLRHGLEANEEGQD
jgi:hypothetical protein